MTTSLSNAAKPRTQSVVQSTTVTTTSTTSTTTKAAGKNFPFVTQKLMDSIIQNFEEDDYSKEDCYPDYSEGRKLKTTEKLSRFGKKPSPLKLSVQGFKVIPLDSYPWFKKNYQADWFKNFKACTSVLYLVYQLILAVSFIFFQVPHFFSFRPFKQSLKKWDLQKLSNYFSSF